LSLSIDSEVVSAYPRGVGVSRVAAWDLAVAISPRDSLRVQLPDAGGGFSSQYIGRASIDGPAPEAPWAVHLTDAAGLFHLVAFDLDGKTEAAARQAVADRDRITGWLDRVGIEYLVCASGGIGQGWHIWVALYDGVPAEVVWAVTDRVKVACPTLDRAPLGNLVTGCVRPPGAPHASGGVSRVVAGDPQVLTRASTTADDLHRLADLIGEEVSALPELTRLDDDILAGLPRDSHGHPYLTGALRPIPATVSAAIGQYPVDASSHLFTILLSLARSRRRFDDVIALLHSPGLEHVRTLRDPHTGHRTPRPPAGPHSPISTLTRQWRRAVAVVATTTDRLGTDQSFLTRAEALARDVEARQQRADASPTRWRGPQGAADRRVLDALHLIALDAVTPDADASIRHLALRTGISREVARTALHRLQTDGWIQLVTPAAGTQAATWTIDPKRDIHNTLESLRSQAVPPRTPPPPTGTTRDRLRTTLTHRQTTARHDLFTRRGLGIEAGNTYARRDETPPPQPDALQDLTDAGLLHPHTPAHLDALAHARGVQGTLARRQVIYAVEQAMWRWWIVELQRTRQRHRHQPALGDKGPWSQWGTHPRRADGRATFKQARLQLLLAA
jgi:hypothetical protein